MPRAIVRSEIPSESGSSILIGSQSVRAKCRPGTTTSVTDTPVYASCPEFVAQATCERLHSLIMPIKIVLLSILVAGAAVNLPAQNPGDDQAIRQFFVDADSAWNHHDAQRLTNPKTTVADGDFINV